MSQYLPERTVRRIVNYWQETGSIADKESLTRSNNLTKITVGELKALDKLIYRRRETECTAGVKLAGLYKNCSKIL